LRKQSLPASNNGVTWGASEFCHQRPITNALFVYKTQFSSNGSLPARLVDSGIETLLSFPLKVDALWPQNYCMKVI